MQRAIIVELRVKLFSPNR